MMQVNVNSFIHHYNMLPLFHGVINTACHITLYWHFSRCSLKYWFKVKVDVFVVNFYYGRDGTTISSIISLLIHYKSKLNGLP
jgi:hypothetical protein